jgi:integrase/recombinase XerD
MATSLKFDPTRCCKKIADWPAPDRDLWMAALLPGDILDDSGARARHSASSNHIIARGWGRYLGWLENRRMLDILQGPVDRIVPSYVRDFVVDLEKTGVATGTVLNYLIAIQVIAKISDAQRNWSWINRIASSVRSRHKPAREKRHRLVAVRVLYDLGLDLMAGADCKNTKRRRSLDYRDGLLLSVLAVRPLRLRNLAGLVLGRTLSLRAAGWWIAIPATDTKNRDPIEYCWPVGLTSHLETYLSDHRSVLAGSRGYADGDPLWVSRYGFALTTRGLYESIVCRTREGLGHVVNPHLFRDCLATNVAIDDPDHVRIASRLLGHRTPATTEKYYNLAGSLEAGRRMQAFLLSLRRGTLDRASG